MDMIDKYLDAIAAQLPQAERDDIIAELRDMILNRFEARERDIGRALSDDERLEILREIGHPLVVATRYRNGPDTLIGPELFPYWLFAVKAGLLIQAALFALSLVLGLLSGTHHVTRDLIQAVHDYVWAGLALIGVTTVVGAVLEHNKIKLRWMTQWRISDLQAFSLADPAAWGSGRWKKPVGGAASVLRRTLPGRDHVISLVANSIFLLWWTGLVQFDALRHLRQHDQDVLVTGAPVWTALYEIILVYMLARVAVDLMALIRPHAVKLQASLEVALGCACLGIIYTVFQAGHWFTLTTGTHSARIGPSPFMFDRGALDGIDNWFDNQAAGISLTLTWGIAILAVVTLARIVRALRRLTAAAA